MRSKSAAAEIFCPGFVRQSTDNEEMVQFLQSRLSISGMEEALEDPYSIPALWRYMELCRSGGVYVSGSQSLGVELGLWLRDKQHELGIQMQWACWERAIGEKFEDWSAAAGGVCNPPFLVVALPLPRMDVARFQPEGLIVCAPHHPLMAELAHDVMRPDSGRSEARIGRSVREQLQDDICRFEPERLSPGWRISKAYGYVYLVDLSEFRRQAWPRDQYLAVSRVARSWRRVGELMPAQVSLLRTKSGERLSPERGLGSRVRAKSGEPRTQSGTEPSSSQFARLELSISTFSQRVMLVRPRKKNRLAVRVCHLFVLLRCSSVCWLS